MHLYRVFPWLETARSGDIGNPLYLPRIQGSGRVDNPDLYKTLYLSDHPEGAIGERWANHSVWTEQLLLGSPTLPGSRTAVARFWFGGRLLDLDDGGVLAQRAIKPSHVVIRDLAITQAWARRIFGERAWEGVSWWSRVDARWSTVGLWDVTSLDLVDVEPLSADHPAVVEARDSLAREWRGA